MVRRREPVSLQVFRQLYPHGPGRSPEEPQSWHSYAKFKLQPEIREHVLRYYGPDNAIESQFPGLDYAWGPHRTRLARWPHHKRLFLVFDRLKLTHHEVNELCSWDYTLHAKQRFEKKHNVVIQDPTGTEIPTWDASQRQKTMRALMLAQQADDPDPAASIHDSVFDEEQDDQEGDFQDDDDFDEDQDGDQDMLSEPKDEGEADELQADADQVTYRYRQQAAFLHLRPGPVRPPTSAASPSTMRGIAATLVRS